MRNAFIRSLTALARQDATVMLLTGDLGFTVFEGFREEFPDRFLNMGVAEQNMISVAAGLAMSGKRVFVYSIIPFATLRCLEQIRNDLCFHHASVCIVGVGGGFAYGHMGASHHALEDIALMRSLSGMTVVCPGDPVEAGAAVPAIAARRGPTYLRLAKSGEKIVHHRPIAFTIGEAITVRQGADLCILSTGAMLETAVEVADLLSDHGLRARVLSMHTLSPIDEASVLATARETPLLVTLEEHRYAGGLGSAVAALLAGEQYRTGLLLCAVPEHAAVSCGSQSYLRQEAGLTAPLLAERILHALHTAEHAASKH